MGRSKRKMKLQLKKPLSNKSNKKYSTNSTDNQGLVSNCDGVNSENLENVNIEPALLNHIKNIRNVDERVLIWNRTDVVDTRANERLHNCLNVDMVIKSMRGSPFAGYLHNQIDQLNRVSKASLSGVVMKPPDIHSTIITDNSSHVANVTEAIYDNALLTELNTGTLSNKEVLNCSTENIECDVSSSTISTNKAEQLNLSPISAVRTSGRAAKKNYLDMLQVPTVLNRKSSDDNSEKSKRHINNDTVENTKSNTRKSKRISRTHHEPTNVVRTRRVRGEINVSEIVENTDEQEKPDKNDDKEDDKEDELSEQMVQVTKEIKEPMSLIKCTNCDNLVTSLSAFFNKCVTCAPKAQKIMTRVKNDFDLACVCDPPCWSQGNVTNECDACVMQRYMSQDKDESVSIVWTKRYTSFAELTVERLRSPEMISKAKDSIRVEGERYLSSRTGSTDSCVIGDEEPLSTPCQWSITTFLETNVEDQCCDVCKEAVSSLHIIMPTKNHFVCHKCLLRAHEATKKEIQPCINSTTCDHCHLNICQSLFPIEAVNRRYRRINIHEYTCTLCQRDDVSLNTLRSGAPICLVCVWRIKTHLMTSYKEQCSIMCMAPAQCGSCLTEIAQHMIANVNEIISHRKVSAKKLFSSKKHSNKKRTKKRIHSNIKMTHSPSIPRASKTPRRNSLEINSNWNIPNLLTDTRQKRVVKPTQFNDFFVGDNNITQLIRRRKTLDSVHPCVNDTSINSVTEEHKDRLYNEDEHEVLDLGDNTNNIRNTKPVLSKVDSNNTRRKITEKNIKRRSLGGEVKSKEKMKVKTVDQNAMIAEENRPKHRRIKQAMLEPVSEPMVLVRSGGPRVKQVSRMGVSCVDLSRQKCVIKTVNRSTKVFDQSECDDSQDTGVNKTPPMSQIIISTESQFEGDKIVNEVMSPENCTIDESVTAINDNINEDVLYNHSDSEDIVENTCSMEPSMDNMDDNMIMATTEQVCEDINDKIITNGIITATNNNTNQQRLADLDVYRDSDNDDVASEEENIDPDLDSINTVKSEMITTSLAHEGGFPIVTSNSAKPNKVLCYSCGSGGDQMIHCVSCAEPFHFFCIEFQFRPKSKEMFVCRNCTKCHTCNNYGSDLKCIKCQVGFHPSCVDKYPPSRSEDRSNWACYKCAMCLHCGTKAEDAMDMLTKDAKQIDWGNDPWQCGRCSRSRKDGHVCPDCGRAYQEGQETVDCHKCTKLVHRQCVGLTEDEYEVHRLAKDSASATSVDTATFDCGKCQEGAAKIEGTSDSLKRRTSLKRQCKESSLKVYCESHVTKRITEYIRESEIKEEQLLEEHNLSGVGASIVRESLLQMDGTNDTSDDIDEDVHCGVGSPVAECLNITMCNSSESVEDYDVDQLTNISVDLDEDGVLSALNTIPKTKVGIFSRLVAEDFLTPRHMVMEALARITIKLGRYPPNSAMPNMYHHSLLPFMRSLSINLFPWLDYDQCISTVHECVRRNSSRQKLIIKALTDLVRDGLQREMDVFSSSVWDIEDKLHQSLIRGRDEFIIYHSEQHLAALMKTLERHTDDTQVRDISKYTLAFVKEGESTMICEKDVRRCALCRCGGDDGLEGRLIYGSRDIWVHVNCALWSDEVYEKEDGALVNVTAAIDRGRRTVCASCHLLGATVHCSANCQNCYHFNCAFNQLIDPVFTESRTFYCSEIHDQSRGETQLGLADMLILRRIYVSMCDIPTSTQCYMSSDDIVITIGNLRIDNLGKLRPYSDMLKAYLCPVDYHARRLFWSMTELDSLVMYVMNIGEETNKNVNLSAPPTIVNVSHKPILCPLKRRRVIDTLDSRHAKRPRPMECRQEIVYEMDDMGNLRPLSSSTTTTSTTSSALNRLLPPAPATLSLDIINKVNRRFPKETKVNRPSDHEYVKIPMKHEHVKIPMKPPVPVSIPALSKPTVPRVVHQQQHHHSQYQVPRTLNLVKYNAQPRPLPPPPPTIIRVPPPPTIIRVPPVKLMIPHSANSRHHNLLRVTKLTPVNKPLQRHPDNPLSVLRTALTVQRHQIDTSTRTNYVISSSGSLVRTQTMPQYDGEADDMSSVSSFGSDHETVANVVKKARKNAHKTIKTYSNYGKLLKYTIEGFSSNRSPKSAWSLLVRRVAQMRTIQGFTEYPLKTRDGWSKFGIDNRVIIFIIEQMVGAYNCHQYDFKYHKTNITKLREQSTRPSIEVFNGTRSIPWVNDQPEHIVRDPLAFLRCKSNGCPKNHAPDHLDPYSEQEPDSDYIQKLAIQFRQLKSGVLARVRNVLVCVSEIHGRGLFARREFLAHEIIIEYVGETIRSILSDVREAEYQKSGVDCYMFRLDQDMIVDATYKGNAARFINHSCQPNCYAKVVKFEGHKHIIIIAQRRIYKGEELTYDYRFPLEEDKLVCTCGSRRCRKYLN